MKKGAAIAFAIGRETSLACLMIVALLALNVRAQTCGPFGDPPDAIISDPVPTCPMGGQLLGPWPDTSKTARYACLYQPATASTQHRLPLVMFLHGGGGNASGAALSTNLLSFLTTANVSGDPSSPGFILLAPQGRNLNHANTPPPLTQHTGWDQTYRQYNSQGTVSVQLIPYVENADAATFDHFIAAEIATDKVDANRIYVIGWSDGGATAYLYGLFRPNIAAIAVYSGPSPFQWGVDPCPQAAVTHAAANDWQIQITNGTLPTWQIKNSCDYMAICQSQEFMINDLLPLGISVEDVIIDANQNSVSACDPTCADPNATRTNVVGLANHLRWPSNWTSEMLDFFSQHPLNQG